MSAVSADLALTKFPRSRKNNHMRKKAIVFDGRAFAGKKEESLTKEVGLLGGKPALAIIIIGNDKASRLYVNLKQKAAQKIGIKTNIYNYKTASVNQIIRKIKSLNKDRETDGILLQLPLPKNLKPYQDKIIHSIKPEKDVDGLRDDSLFTPATVKATFYILEKAGVSKKNRILIIGSEGEVGSRLLKKLSEKDYSVVGIDTKEDLKKHALVSEVIISAAGKPGLIDESMVKRGVVAIDIGSPEGDIDGGVRKKASFITPVPGGVGPVTIACLLENLVQAAEG